MYLFCSRYVLYYLSLYFYFCYKESEEGGREEYGTCSTVKCRVFTVVIVFCILLIGTYLAFIPFFQAKVIDMDICQGSIQNVEVQCEGNCTNLVTKHGILFSNQSLYNCSQVKNNTLQCLYCRRVQNDWLLMFKWLGPLLGFLILFLIVIISQCVRADSCCKVVLSFMRSVYELFLIAFFCPLPMKDEAKCEWDVELITLKFIAWEYAGCDTLWAGIITCLCDKLEERFGQYKSRYFRKIKGDYEENVDLMVKNKTFSTDYKTMRPYTCCYVPNFVLVIATIVIILFLPLAVAVIVLSSEQQSIKITVSGILLVGGILPMIPFVVKLFLFLKKSSKSYIKNLHQVMSRPDFKEELGFMHLVKKEVQLLNDLIDFMEMFERKQFRIVLLVDDLDRCEKKKVLKMLEAVSILLSEANTKFISLIAVDPRVVVKSLELTLDVIHQDSRINGYEYLKKIIHLPLWLPEIDDDKVKKLVKSYMPSKISKDNAAPGGSGGYGTATATEQSYPPNSNGQGNLQNREVKIEPNRNAIDPDQDGVKAEIHRNAPDALTKAFEEILKQPENVCHNPRSVKRICNVLNLALRLYTSKIIAAAPELEM